MQTTLLGLAVAIILALVTALVGPLFIDWGRYRSTFEAEATRLIGAPVRVTGGIDARLLPAPSLVLNGIEAGTPGRDSKLRARAIGVEFSLGSLVRGEWRAAVLHVDGPEFTLGLDQSGNIDAPPVSTSFGPDQLSIERLVVENGRAVFADAASGGRLVLEKLWFNGDVRSLVGPFKGEGAFVSAGQVYGYRIVGGRRGDDGGMKLRLAVDPSDRPLAMETEGTLWVERGLPRYEGSLTLARPAGKALSSGKTLFNEPWRATSRVKASPSSALFEQVEFQYGPEERAIKLTGTAVLRFGARPQLEGVLSARQVDVDRVLTSPDATQRPPVAVLRSIADNLVAAVRPSLPVKIGIAVDNLMLGGAPLTAIRGDVQIDGDAWSVETFEFRAPGASQIRFSGRFRLAPNPEFTGPADIESSDPRALIAWLEGRPDAMKAPIGPLRARGDVTLGAERIAVDRLKAELNRKAVEGRVAYAYAAGPRAARLDATLSGAEFDVDGAIAFANDAQAAAEFDRPGEIALAVDFGKSTYGGIEAKDVKANLKLDSQGLHVERLAIADFGGALVNASGRIDTSLPSPRGSIALTIEAQRLDGISALAAKFAPRAADALKSLTGRAALTTLNAKLDIEPVNSSASDAKTSAKLRVNGAVAGMRANVLAEATGAPAAPLTADIRLDGRFESEDGASLAALIGLDRLAVVEKRPAKLVVTASGPARGDLRLDGKFSGAGLDASVAGALRFSESGAAGMIDVALSAADARLPRRDAGMAIPVTIATRIAVADDQLTFGDLRGRVAGAAVKGRLAVVLQHPMRIEGRIDAETVDATAVIATAIGSPPHISGRRSTAWLSEPFVASPFANFAGRIEFTAAQAIFAPGIVARQIHGAVRFEPSGFTLENIEGSLGEGRLAALVNFHGQDSGLSAQGRVRLIDADMASLLPRRALGQVTGRISLEVEAQGAGLSPAALVGAVQGTGTLTVESLQVAGLDPKAIDAAIRAAERGVSINAVRIGEIVRASLDAGRLNIPRLSSPISVVSGRAALTRLTTPAEGADVSVAGSLDLTEEGLDLRFTLTGPAKANAPGGERPEISVMLKGPIESPRRTVDVAALVNWLTLRAVEQEAKRLEEAEQEARRIQAIEAARRAAAEEARRLEAIEAARRAAAEEARRLEAIEAARRARAQEATVPAHSPAGDGPSIEKAPDLPPPIDIRPAPGGGDRRARRSTPRGESVPASAVAPTGLPSVTVPLPDAQ